VRSPRRQSHLSRTGRVGSARQWFDRPGAELIHDINDDTVLRQCGTSPWDKEHRTAVWLGVAIRALSFVTIAFIFC
jgi:hypothetical protein